MTIGGIILHLKRKKTRTGKMMGVFKLEDLTGSIEVIIFPDAYQKLAQLVEEDEMIVVRGMIDDRDDTPKIITDDIIPFAEAREKLIHVVEIRLSTAGLEEETLKKLEEVFRRNRGKCRVKLDLKTLHHGNLHISTDYNIQVNDNTLKHIEELVGKEAIHLST